MAARGTGWVLGHRNRGGRLVTAKADVSLDDCRMHFAEAARPFDRLVEADGSVFWMLRGLEDPAHPGEALGVRQLRLFGEVRFVMRAAEA